MIMHLENQRFQIASRRDNLEKPAHAFRVGGLFVSASDNPHAVRASRLLLNAVHHQPQKSLQFFRFGHAGQLLKSKPPKRITRPHPNHCLSAQALPANGAVPTANRRARLLGASLFR